MRARFIPLLLVPLTGLEAQTPRSPTPAPAQKRQPTMFGACASLSSVPSELVRTPEGMALLRFKKELEGVATVFVQKDSAMKWGEARRVWEVQRGVDSLMQVFVRFRAGDPAQAPVYTLRKGDSATYFYSKRKGDSTTVVYGKTVEGWPTGDAMEGAIKAIRPNVDVTVRSFEPRLHALSQGGARMVTTASSTGYMGVNLSGAQIRMVTDSGVFTAHCDYPMIEAVDVGSPARQADLRAGDTIVAYNGRDIVAQTVNYPQLLVPGKVVRVRVRRDGKARDMPVTVAERPPEVAENVMRWAPMPGGTMLSGTMVGGTMTPMPARPGSAGAMIRTVPGTAPLPRFVAANASMMTLLGAQLNAVDEEFGQRIGIEPGILVLRVHSGTPAAEAGLRMGDLILAVNGTPTRELLVVQRAINAPGVHDVKLTVTAKDTPARIVTIRW